MQQSTSHVKPAERPSCQACECREARTANLKGKSRMALVSAMYDTVPGRSPRSAIMAAVKVPVVEHKRADRQQVLAIPSVVHAFAHITTSSQGQHAMQQSLSPIRFSILEQRRQDVRVEYKFITSPTNRQCHACDSVCNGAPSSPW